MQSTAFYFVCVREDDMEQCPGVRAQNINSKWSLSNAEHLEESFQLDMEVVEPICDVSMIGKWY